MFESWTCIETTKHFIQFKAAYFLWLLWFCATYVANGSIFNNGKIQSIRSLRLAHAKAMVLAIGWRDKEPDSCCVLFLRWIIFYRTLMSPSVEWRFASKSANAFAACEDTKIGKLIATETNCSKQGTSGVRIEDILMRRSCWPLQMCS